MIKVSKESLAVLARFSTKLNSILSNPMEYLEDVFEDVANGFARQMREVLSHPRRHFPAILPPSEMTLLYRKKAGISSTQPLYRFGEYANNIQVKKTDATSFEVKPQHKATLHMNRQESSRYMDEVAYLLEWGGTNEMGRNIPARPIWNLAIFRYIINGQLKEIKYPQPHKLTAYWNSL